LYINIILRVGQWIEKRFPEKISAESVRADLEAITSSINELTGRIEVIEQQSDIPVLQDHLERIKKLEEQIKTMQTQATFKSRIVGSVPDTMTPFATRLPPVMPTNGGAKSLQ